MIVACASTALEAEDAPPEKSPESADGQGQRPAHVGSLSIALILCDDRGGWFFVINGHTVASDGRGSDWLRQKKLQVKNVRPGSIEFVSQENGRAFLVPLAERNPAAQRPGGKAPPPPVKGKNSSKEKVSKKPEKEEESFGF